MSSLDGWGLEQDKVVTETYLSRKPAPRSVTAALASVSFLFLCSVAYWSDIGGIAMFLPASREAVFVGGEYWRLVTSMFIHADLQHFLSNGLVLGVLSFLVYGYYGPRVFPAMTVLLGAVVTGISVESYPARVTLVGASGLVYLLAGFWLSLYLRIERRWPLKKRLFRAIGFGCIVLLPTAIEPGVSYRTHFIGFAVGVLFGLAYFSREKQRLRAAERIVFES